MSLAGMLVEYLITGCSALIWIWLILLLPGADLPAGVNARELEAHQVAFFVPILYVLGLFIDYLAKGLTDFLDERVRQQLWRSAARRLSKFTQEDSRLGKWLAGPKSYDGSIEYADIFFHAPDLGKQLELRSTRDRVARGALMNTLLIGATLAWYSNETGYAPLSLVIIATLVGCWIWFMIWLRLHRLTDKYHMHAGEVIERNQAVKSPNLAAPADRKALLSGR
jgi:hypothetical protein